MAISLDLTADEAAITEASAGEAARTEIAASESAVTQIAASVSIDPSTRDVYMDVYWPVY